MRTVVILVVCAMIGSCALMEPKKKKKQRFMPAPAAARHYTKPAPEKPSYTQSDPVRPENIEKAKEDLNKDINVRNWELEQEIKKQKELLTP